MRARPYLHIPDNSRLTSERISGRPGTSCAAVFLDRDGVIVEDVHFLTTPSQLCILPGVVEALRALQKHFLTIIVTNQSGIARGFLTEEGLFAIHLELVSRLAFEGAVLDALYYCPHLPKPSVEACQADCECRKPKPGMLLRAALDWGIDMGRSFIVGDRARDIEAGHAAGVKGIMLENGNSAVHDAHIAVSSLSAATRLILAKIDGQTVSHQRASLRVD